MKGRNKKVIYADNAATTALKESAFNAMLPYLKESFGNPSAIYDYGIEAKNAVEGARKRIADVIGARVNEIFFTSGGTESDNWALHGTVEARGKKGGHIITTAIEHSAVFRTAEKLQGQGIDVTYLPVDHLGQVSLEELVNAIREDTILVSIMLANNEIGTLLPIAKIGEITKERKVMFHTDAVQGVGHIPVNVEQLGVDLLSLSAHKFGGPKGIGALYIRVGRTLPPLLTGGGQEKGRRSGTQNVPAIVGMAEALKDAADHMDGNVKKITALRTKFTDGVLKLPGARLTGDPKYRLPGLASFVFEGCESKPLVSALNELGVCASSGSACSAGSGEPSRVLKAAGYSKALAGSSLRFSFNEYNTEEDVDYILEKLELVLAGLRS